MFIIINLVKLKAFNIKFADTFVYTALALPYSPGIKAYHNSGTSMGPISIRILDTVQGFSFYVRRAANICISDEN